MRNSRYLTHSKTPILSLSAELSPPRWHRGSNRGRIQELQKTRLQALRQWKGPKQKQFEFRIDVQCCVCGYEFPKSGDFLVYAYGPDEDGHFQTSICNRTRHLSQAADDIAVLDVLVKDANLPNKTMEPTR
jgi:hypothetical protein